MKENKGIELDFSDITAAPKLNRRDFLKTLGGGIIVLFWAGEGLELEA